MNGVHHLHPRISPRESSYSVEMRFADISLLTGLACGWPVMAGAQLQLAPDAEPQAVFAGDARNVTTVWHNAGDQTVSIDFRVRIFQTSSETAVLIADRPGRHLEVPAGETVLDSATLNFPAVKAESKFIVQWLENTNRVLGTTKVWVYPTNLLAALKPLAGDVALGVFDPANQLKPLLIQLKIDSVNLEDSNLEDFSGRLAIVGPFQSRSQARDGLAEQVRALAKRNVAVVWMQPPPKRCDRLSPSFYSIVEGTNAVIVAHNDLLPNLLDNPRSQLKLIYLCKLALRPEPHCLTDITSLP
jgi:hypothetical protein